MSGHPKPLRTLDARPSHNTMIKPGELIDVVEMSPLTLTDRRVYNTLIAHAWDKIEQPVTHVIAKKDLRGSRDQNDRVGESVERLMVAIARLEIEREGKRYIRRVQLLGATDEGREDDGLLYYRFPAELRAIIRNSSIFARLRMDVIFALSSKYALALYELVQKRGNLEWQHSEEFTIERFRQLLGVEPGKLESFKNLNKWAIQPAALEVNALSDFGCKVEPVLAGRKVVKIMLAWWRKNEDELKAAYRELQAAKVGRRARMKGTVEQVTPCIEPSSLPAITPRPTATGGQITLDDLVLTIPPEIPEEEPFVNIEDYLDDEYLDELPPIERSPEPASLPRLFRLIARHSDFAVLDMPSLDKILVSAQEVDDQTPGLLRVKTAARRLVQEAEPLYRDFAIVKFEDVPAEATISREEWDELRQCVQQAYEKASALEHRLNALHSKTTPPSRTT